MSIKMSSYGLNAGMKTPVALNDIAINAFLHSSPNIDQTLCNKWKKIMSVNSVQGRHQLNHTTKTAKK